MATESACLLLTDISGYTGYLAGVELDHAQDILADLMGTIVNALRPGSRLAKLEGEAAFMFAITEKLEGSLLLDTIERCYAGRLGVRDDAGPTDHHRTDSDGASPLSRNDGVRADARRNDPPPALRGTQDA